MPSCTVVIKFDSKASLAYSLSGAQPGSAFLCVYVQNDPVNFTDPMGLTWGESLGMFLDWATGSGPDSTLFGPGSNQVNDMKNSAGVVAARQAFYRKNAGAKCDDDCANKYQPLTNYNPGFGFPGLIKAGFNSTQQFIGNFRVDIYPDNSNCIITIMLSNTTSMTSFSYHLFDSWERSSRGPGGNTRQVYWWTEPIRK